MSALALLVGVLASVLAPTNAIAARLTVTMVRATNLPRSWTACDNCNSMQGTFTVPGAAAVSTGHQGPGCACTTTGWAVATLGASAAICGRTTSTLCRGGRLDWGVTSSAVCVSGGSVSVPFRVSEGNVFSSPDTIESGTLTIPAFSGATTGSRTVTSSNILFTWRWYPCTGNHYTQGCSGSSLVCPTCRTVASCNSNQFFVPGVCSATGTSDSSQCAACSTHANFSCPPGYFRTGSCGDGQVSHECLATTTTTTASTTTRTTSTTTQSTTTVSTTSSSTTTVTSSSTTSSVTSTTSTSITSTSSSTTATSTSSTVTPAPPSQQSAFSTAGSSGTISVLVVCFLLLLVLVAFFVVRGQHKPPTEKSARPAQANPIYDLSDSAPTVYHSGSADQPDAPRAVESVYHSAGPAVLGLGASLSAEGQTDGGLPYYAVINPAGDSSAIVSDPSGVLYELPLEGAPPGERAVVEVTESNDSTISVPLSKPGLSGASPTRAVGSYSTVSGPDGVLYNVPTQFSPGQQLYSPNGARTVHVQGNYGEVYALPLAGPDTGSSGAYIAPADVQVPGADGQLYSVPVDSSVGTYGVLGAETLRAAESAEYSRLAKHRVTARRQDRDSGSGIGVGDEYEAVQLASAGAAHYESPIDEDESDEVVGVRQDSLV